MKGSTTDSSVCDKSEVDQEHFEVSTGVSIDMNDLSTFSSVKSLLVVLLSLGSSTV